MDMKQAPEGTNDQPSSALPIPETVKTSSREMLRRNRVEAEGEQPSPAPVPEIKANDPARVEAIRKMLEAAPFAYGPCTVSADVVQMGPPPPPTKEPEPAYTIGPDYVPSPEEMARLEARLKRSVSSRDRFIQHCAALRANPVKVPNLEESLYDRFDQFVKAGVEDRKEREQRELSSYRPKGIKARFFFFVERTLRRIVSWFTYREKAVVEEIVAPPKPKTEADILQDNIRGAFLTHENGDPTGEFFGAIWDIIQDTTDENLVKLPGESRQQAINRVVQTAMIKYQQKQSIRDQEDSLLGLEDGQCGYVEGQVDYMEDEPKKKPKVRNGPMQITKGLGTDVSKIAKPNDGSLPDIAARPTWLRGTMIAKLNEDRVAVDYVGVPDNAIKERVAPEDPILAKLREQRLDQLLSKDVLTEAEKRELEDLTPGSVNVL